VRLIRLFFISELENSLIFSRCIKESRITTLRMKRILKNRRHFSSSIAMGLFALLSCLLIAAFAAPVDHIVAFHFGPIDNSTVALVVKRYLALKDLCVDPVTNQTYIVSFHGGVPNSKEGFQQSMQLVFRMTLPNEYYRWAVLISCLVDEKLMRSFFLEIILWDVHSPRPTTRIMTRSSSLWARYCSQDPKG
jgi:hypothetical protein